MYNSFNVLKSTCSIKIIYYKSAKNAASIFHKIMLSDVASRFLLQSQHVKVGPWQIWIFSLHAVAVYLALIAACPHRIETMPLEFVLEFVGSCGSIFSLQLSANQKELRSILAAV